MYLKFIKNLIAIQTQILIENLDSVTTKKPECNLNYLLVIINQ